MKVMHITMSGSFGGAETVIFSIIDALNKECEFYYISPQGKVEKYLIAKNIKYLHFNKKNIWQIKKIIKQINPDIIHAHDFTASILCAILAPKKFIISHLHTSHNWIKSFSFKTIIYFCSAFFFNHIIVVSNTMFKEFCLSSFFKNKLKVLTNPIDIVNIKKLSQEFEINKSYDVAFLGRLSDYKDPIRFIDIVNRSSVIKSSILIGDGELRRECSEIIKKNNLENRIEVVGFQKNPFPYLKNTKILIVPSKVEALGLAAMQALSLGIPVVASNIGGLKDLITDNENGFLCENDQQFINKIDYLLKNEYQYTSFSKNAQISGKKFMNSIDYSQQILNLYNEVNGGKK